MCIENINPYVRYSREHEGKINKRKCRAYDHRIFYSLSDSGTIRVDGKDYNMKKGTVIFWKSGIPYQDVTENGHISYIGCNFDFFKNSSYPLQPVGYNYAENYREEMLFEKPEEVDLSFFPDVIYIPFCDIYSRFKEIDDEFNCRELFFDIRCSAILKDILVYIFRVYSTGESYKTKSDSDDILMYIREHYSEALTNEMVAKKFSYHPNYIGNIVKKRTGETLHQYVINYRMTKAIGFLGSRRYSVAEVAELVGYEDAAHFSKSFKKVTGISPSEYLK